MNLPLNKIVHSITGRFNIPFPDYFIAPHALEKNYLSPRFLIFEKWTNQNNGKSLLYPGEEKVRIYLKA